ncbi:MAG: hypothetical protein ACXWCS_29135, partial [Burkholderiales bacterium]
LRDGGMLTQECLSARGGPDRPFTDEEILSKISRLTASAYPNFAAIVRDACELDPQRLRQGWAEVVSEFCAEA